MRGRFRPEILGRLGSSPRRFVQPSVEGDFLLDLQGLELVIIRVGLRIVTRCVQADGEKQAENQNFGELSERPIKFNTQSHSSSLVQPMLTTAPEILQKCRLSNRQQAPLNTIQFGLFPDLWRVAGC